MCLAEIMLVSKGTKKQNAKLGKGSEQERLFVNKYSKKRYCFGSLLVAQSFNTNGAKKHLGSST